MEDDKKKNDKSEKIKRTKRKRKSEEANNSPSSACCQGDGFLWIKRGRMSDLGTAQVKPVTANSVIAALSNVAESGGTAGRGSRPSQSAGEGGGRAVKVGESGANGGVERGDGKEQMIKQTETRVAEMTRHGGRYEGETKRNSKAVEKDDGTEGGKKNEVRNDDIVKKELVIDVEIEGNDNITMIELLKAVELTCGRVIGCRTKTNKRWELTMSNMRGKERLLDGFKIKNSKIVATELVKDTRVVSFLNLPLYITDNQIKEKLCQWGVEPTSEIRRRKWAGTEIYDGTRFLKVKFPDNISSLPYSTKFDTLEGLEYFRVLHDQQVRVCRLCLQPGHILRDCPEFACYRCKKQGHYARECVDRTVETTETGEMMEEENEEVDDGGEEEATSEVETDEEEREESEEEVKTDSKKEKDSREKLNVKVTAANTLMLRGKSAMTEQGRRAEPEDGGNKRGRSRSAIRNTDRGDNLMTDEQENKVKGIRLNDMAKGGGKDMVGEERETLPQRETRRREKKETRKK